MSDTLRVNEALLIADQAFQPYQCVAWAAQDGHGELNITVYDRTQTRHLARTRLPSSLYRDPQALVRALEAERHALNLSGVSLNPWQVA